MRKHINTTIGWISVCLVLLLPIVIYSASQAEQKTEESQSSLDPDRILNQNDLNRLLTLSHQLIDKRNHFAVRTDAVSELQKLRHRHAIPALLAVAYDDSNRFTLRTDALLAASRIPDKLVVDHLIELIDDEQSYGLAQKAHCRLYWITGRDRKTYEPLPEDPKSEDRAMVQREWREWWRENRENVKYSLKEATSGGFGVGCFPGFFPTDEK